MMKFDNIDDFPQLTPDEGIHFDAKNEIRRSPELDFKCSELEYMYLVAAEEGLETENDPLVEQYKKIRLKPDMNIVMPDKKSLKQPLPHPIIPTKARRLLWISAAVAAAVAFILIITQNTPENSPVVEINSEEILSPTQTPVKDIVPEQKSDIVPIIYKVRKKSVAQTVENITTEKDLLAETVEIEPDSLHLAAEAVAMVKLEPIPSISVPLEMMNREKTVFVNNRTYQQNSVQRTVDNIALAVGRNIIAELSTEIKDTKQNLAQKLEGFKLTNIMSKLKVSRGIDKHIDEWVENNKDVPFEVVIDYFADNSVTEIFAENGTLVKAVFLTNKSSKYKDKKAYQALNN
jgi:hypothetical protein